MEDPGAGDRRHPSGKSRLGGATWRASLVVILVLSVASAAVPRTSTTGHRPRPAATPMPTPWVAPVSTRTASVPPSIDSTGSSDASRPISAWLRTIPDGTVVTFKSEGTYRFDQAVQISGRRDLTLDGMGATVRIDGCKVEDSAFVIDGEANAGIVIRNFTIIGDNAAAGTTAAFEAGCESQMGVAIYGGQGIEVDHLTISRVHADCIYIDASGDPRGTGVWADSIYFHDSTCRLNGRMGVAITAAEHVTIQRVAFEDVAISVLDLEPYVADGGAMDIRFVDNVVQGYAASPTYSGWLVETGAYGMTTTTIQHVTVARNQIAKGATESVNSPNPAGLTIKMRTVRSGDVVIVDNVSTAVGQGPTIYLEHVDGATVSGNTQPLTSGILVWASDSIGSDATD
jgi:Right handed beta helix region